MATHGYVSMALFPHLEIDYANHKIRFTKSDRTEERRARLARGSRVLLPNDDEWVEWSKVIGSEMARLLELPGEFPRPSKHTDPTTGTHSCNYSHPVRE